jgi:hypothetical protein
VAGHDVVRYELFYGERERAMMLNQPFYKDVDRYSSFTVAELGELLPTVIFMKDEPTFPLAFLAFKLDDTYTRGLVKMKKYKVQYEDMFVDDELWGTQDENEANARAKMLIYLIENKLL